MECPARFGQYDLIRRIAVGGMAEIYLAKVGGLAGFQKHLVLKVIHPKFAADPEFVEMLVHEAKLAVRLTHNNIAQVFDLGVQDDRYFIAMEYVDGLDIYQFLRRLRDARFKMPFEVAAFIIAEASAALDYAHGRRDELGRPLGIIHRDISPQNVLLSYEGDVKIIDFGIAKVKASSQSTAAGVIKGKFFYMSPEQARGRDLDNRSDIFAVGALFYELLTLRMLYDTESINDALRLAKRGAFLPASAHRPDLPDALDRIVLKSLARDRAQRYQTAGELRAALTGWLRKASPGFGPHRLESHIRDVCGVNTQMRLTRLRRDEFRVRRHQSMIVRDDPSDDVDGREPDAETREISPSIRRRSEAVVDEPAPQRSDRAADALARRIREARANLRWTDEHDVPNGLGPGDVDPEAETHEVFARATTQTQVRVDDLRDDAPTHRDGGDAWPLPRNLDDSTLPDPTRRRPNGPTESERGRGSADADDYPAPSVLQAERSPLGESTDVDETVVDPGPLRRALEEAEAVMRLDEVDPTPVESAVEGTTSPYERGRPPRRERPVAGSKRKAKRPPPRDAGRRDQRPSPPPPPPPGRNRAAGSVDQNATTAPKEPRVQRTQAADEDFRDTTWPEPISGARAERPRSRRGLLVGIGAGVLALGIALGFLIGPTAVQPVAEGSLFITSRPRLGATIYLDGQRTDFSTPAVIHKLAGNSRHDVRVVLSGFEAGVADDVSVQPDTQTEVVINLTPARYSATITSVPAGAEIVVDGQVLDRTPATLDDLPVDGEAGLTVLLRLPGHLDSVFTLHWPAGETHRGRNQTLTPSD